MRTRSLLLLLSCAALGSGAAVGQSLSIVRQGQSNYWIEASAPVTDPHTLQASANLHLWVDVYEPVQGQFSRQLAGTGVLQRYFRLAPSSPPAPPIIVMLLGDSMAADGSGWGWGMYGYFKPNVTFVNYGIGNASTRTFLQSEELDKMLLIKPNYVLINFGGTDSVYDPDRFTTLEEFGQNLRSIAGIVRNFNGVPIFVTIHSARIWDESGHLIPSWGERNNVIKQVAAELQTPLVDLNQLTFVLFDQLGPDGTAFMQFGAPTDHVHLSWEGSKVVSRLVVNALPDSFGPYLTGIFDPPPFQP